MDEEKTNLLVKKREGTLTEEEYDRYLELLYTDADFYEEASLYSLLQEVGQQEADIRRWNELETALSKTKTQGIGVVWLYQNTAWVAAASIGIIILGVWWWISQPTKEQLLSNRNTEIFLADSLKEEGRAYFGGQIPITELSTQWLLNPSQTHAITCFYCQDTLKLSVKMAKDTIELGKYVAFFSTKTQQISLKYLTEKPVPLDSCKTTIIHP